MGILDRSAQQMRAEAHLDTKKIEQQGFIEETDSPNATVITDGYVCYQNLVQQHVVVKHSVKEFVN